MGSKPCRTSDENGIDVVLDQWSVELGGDLPAFMEGAVRDIGRVLVICTDAYIQKAAGDRVASATR